MMPSFFSRFWLVERVRETGQVISKADGEAGSGTRLFFFPSPYLLPYTPSASTPTLG